MDQSIKVINYSAYALSKLSAGLDFCLKDPLYPPSDVNLGRYIPLNPSSAQTYAGNTDLAACRDACLLNLDCRAFQMTFNVLLPDSITCTLITETVGLSTNSWVRDDAAVVYSVSDCRSTLPRTAPLQCVVADIPVMSPRKLFIFIIRNDFCWIKASP